MFDYVVIPEPVDASTALLARTFEIALGAPDPDSATLYLMEELGQAFHAKRSYIYQLPPGGTEFECSCEWCAPGVEPMTDVTHGLTVDMASRWFGDGSPRSLLAVRDVADIAAVNPAYAAFFAQRGMRTQVLGKLMRGSSPLGTLGFDDPDPEFFDLLCGCMYPICAFATSAINTQNLLNRIRSTGVIDKLTGAGTRMGFYQTVERLPPEIPCGMAYLDIVGLQGLNDVRGHEAGNELLIAVRQTLITEFKDDQVFRMAGDEFLVLAPGMPERTFYAAMDRIRGRLDEFSVYVAMGVFWQEHLGSEYETLVQHTWLSCANSKQEWERRGGMRLGESYSDHDAPLWSHREAESSATDMAGHLDIPCYRNDEFFHRANGWSRHAQGDNICVIAFDINYFKLYNDIFGRDAGDVLLESYAQGLSAVAKNYHGVPGYLGGDNFVLAIPLRDGVTNEQLSSVIERELNKYNVAEGFAPSAGVVITKDRDMGMTILYDRALVALQEIKGNYTDHVAFYDERRYERERENQMTLIRAQEGLARGEFTFYLQPKVDINTNKVVSAEALVRWIHDGEVVPPYRFIGLMERSGYIFALDRFVWESVCAWQRSLIDRGITPVPVSVNVSRVDFHFADLADHFLSLVEHYELPPRLVGIEVTESAYSKDPDRINDVIRRMQSAGFLVFMDDFGSGYSSLNMLRSVAVDVLKMDKGFIDNADIKAGPDAIISNVIKMAHMMGLPVISEGVETEEQRDSLRSMECDYVQGYFYYRPMDIDTFEDLLRTGESVELEHSDNIILALTSGGISTEVHGSTLPTS